MSFPIPEFTAKILPIFDGGKALENVLRKLGKRQAIDSN